MFGYILPHKPNLYMKDFGLYRGFYCGLCHEIGHCQGLCMRLTVNYDVTFLSILLYGLRDKEVTPVKKACILHPFGKKAVVLGEEQREMAYLNTLLCDFKCQDDVLDGKKGARIPQNLFARRIKQARKALPEVADVLDKAVVKQQKVEGENPASWRIAAEPFADCIQEIVRLLAKDRYTLELGNVCYGLGQYVYLMDALDDYDKDIAKHNFNPLVATYGCATKAQLLAEHKGEILQDINDLIQDIKDNYRNVAIYATEGIVTNTLWMGLGARASEIVKENKQCLKTHTKF